MTEIERFEEVRFFFKKNKKDFAELLGYKNSQTYTNILSGNTSISMKAMHALKKLNNAISIDWLLWGQGNMLLSSPSITDQKIMNGDHTQATITGNITNNSKDASLFDKKHVEFLEEKIKDKEINIKTLQEFLESKKITINLYQERVAALEKEVQQLREHVNR